MQGNDLFGGAQTSMCKGAQGLVFLLKGARITKFKAASCEGGKQAC